MPFPETSVIGTGGLGTALTKALSAREIPIKSVFNRSMNKAQKLAQELSINKCGDFPSTIEELGDLVFITVADRAIEKVVNRLAKLDGDVETKTFVHCSGNESAGLLEPLKSKGAAVASFHPLQTFTNNFQPGDFSGIYFSLQGDDKAFPILKEVAQQLGAQTLEVTKEQKSNLHAAAVMASNYLNTLLNEAVEIGAAGNIPDSKVKEALLPLVQTTLKNAGKNAFAESLSGPIKRGDISTVKKHLALLEGRDELKKLYCVLGLHTVKLAESAGHLDGTTAEKMRKILSVSS